MYEMCSYDLPRVNYTSGQYSLIDWAKENTYERTC